MMWNGQIVSLLDNGKGKVNLCLNSDTAPSLWLQPKCSFFWVTRRHEINAKISLGFKGYFSATFSLASQLSENEVPSITIKQQKEYFKSDTLGNQQVFVWGPIHTYPFLFHFIHIFFPRIGLPSTRSWWKRKRSPDRRWVKTRVYSFCVDGRKRNFSNTMIIIQRMPCKGCYRIFIILAF